MWTICVRRIRRAAAGGVTIKRDGNTTRTAQKQDVECMASVREERGEGRDAIMYSWRGGGARVTGCGRMNGWRMDRRDESNEKGVWR